MMGKERLDGVAEVDVDWVSRRSVRWWWYKAVRSRELVDVTVLAAPVAIKVVWFDTQDSHDAKDRSSARSK